MRYPHEVYGFPAAEGIFHGPIFWIDEQPGSQSLKGARAEELSAFETAVKTAIKELQSLSFRSPEPAGDVLAIQVAWLEDPELLLPVARRIAAGESAASAWRAEIADHSRAIDPSAFEDIRDIEQRVFKLLVKSERSAPPKGVVLAGRDISPTQFLEMDWSKGGAILLEEGSAASHAAILARGRGIPMIVEAGSLGRDHKFALVDGSSGKCVLDPVILHHSVPSLGNVVSVNAHNRAMVEAKKVKILFNINSLDEIAFISSEWCEGVGLVRSEFLFRETGSVPDENTQALAYATIARWAKGKPVTIRLFDLGGDKPAFGLGIPKGGNGVENRGMNVLLNEPAVLISQLRALLTACNDGDVRILLPMVSNAEQLSEVRSLLKHCEPASMAPIKLGVMMEVPEVAMHPEFFADADFFALGTNDLAQFITGRSRASQSGAKLSISEQSKLFKIIGKVVDYGREQNKAVCLCGDLASDFNSLDDLLRLGLRALSVPPLKAIELARLRSGL